MMRNEDFTGRDRLEDVGRWFIDEFVERVARQLPAGTRVLDAGAGECAYQRFFAHCEYRSVDRAVGDAAWSYANLDVVAALERLPFAGNTFDAVLCTQALEHLEFPRESVRELFRVLKPGGTLHLTAPMAHPEHFPPYDFFRYTSFGLRSILSGAGFARIAIEPCGGLFTRWAYELPRALAMFPAARSPDGTIRLKGATTYPLKLLCRMGVRLAQRGLLRLERFDRRKDDPFGWLVTAVKTAGANG
jgi:SAM-dependent methyltransferase